MAERRRSATRAAALGVLSSPITLPSNSWSNSNEDHCSCLPVILLAEMDYLLTSRLGVDAGLDFLDSVARLPWFRRPWKTSCGVGNSSLPIAKSEPVSIFWRAPPNSGSFLGLFPTGCAIPSSSLSCSKDEPCRHGPCSSFRSSEEPHAGFTTVVLGSLTLASLGVLPVGCLRALVVARVGVVGPKLASRLRAVSSGAFTRRLDTQRLARHNT